MRKIIAFTLVILALAAPERIALGAPNFGKLGVVPDVPSTGGGGGNACVSGMNGIIDLTNACNMIYFIGGLK